jgi:hypothetical protein
MVQDLPHKLTLLHEFQKSRKDMEQKWGKIKYEVL